MSESSAGDQLEIKMPDTLVVGRQVEILCYSKKCFSW